MDDCIFCKIAKGELPSYKVWEDDNHIAILNIFPRFKGVTIVLTKSHAPSNMANLDDKALADIWRVAKTLGKKLESAFGVERCAYIAEGTGVDHAHIKIYPLHGYVPGQATEPHHPEVLDHYPGFISSEEGPRADDQELDIIAKKIRGE